MNLRVLYFASMRDQAGVDAEQVATGATDARGLYAELRARHCLALDPARLRVAVNGAFAAWEQALRDGDEVVFMPPVSGGQPTVDGLARFTLSAAPIDAGALGRVLARADAGASVTFAGWVRDHNSGRAVLRLDYQAYTPLAASEGERILAEAMAKFAVAEARCAHRTGALAIGDLAVWVGVSAAHRGAAFEACRFIIDEVKLRVPIWKNEHYADGESGWLHPDNTPVAT